MANNLTLKPVTTKSSNLFSGKGTSVQDSNSLVNNAKMLQLKTSPTSNVSGLKLNTDINVKSNTLTGGAGNYTIKAATPTVSVSSAQNSAANGKIQNIISEYDKNKKKYTTLDGKQSFATLEEANAYNDTMARFAQKKESTTPVTTTKETTTTPTAEQLQLNEIEHPGQKELYNVATGTKEWVEPGTAGYIDTDPNELSQSYTDKADVGGGSGIEIRKLSDGSYVRWNTSTGSYAGGASEGDFQSAKSIENTRNEIQNLKKGIYTDYQQTQLDKIQSDYEKNLDILKTENEKITGGMTVAQNMYGMGTTLMGQGEIQKTVTDGIERVNDLIVARDNAMAQMKQSFIDDNVSELQSAFSSFTSASAEIQANIDKLKEDMAAKNKALKTQQIDTAIAAAFSQGVEDPVDLLMLLNSQGYSVTSEDIDKTLSVIQKSVTEAEKKQQDVIDAAQTEGDFKTAELVRLLDPRSPTFQQDLANLEGRIRTEATESEKSAYEIDTTYAAFDNMKGSDGYVDPYEYMRLRAQSNLSSSDFDKRFGHFVNPERYGMVGLTTKAEKLYDETNIPSTVRNDLVSDLQSNKNAKRKDKKTLADFYNAYPEIESSYIDKLFELEL